MNDKPTFKPTTTTTTTKLTTGIPLRPPPSDFSSLFDPNPKSNGNKEKTKGGLEIAGEKDDNEEGEWVYDLYFKAGDGDGAATAAAEGIFGTL